MFYISHEMVQPLRPELSLMEFKLNEDGVVAV